MAFIDNNTILIPCPKCGHKTAHTVAELNTDPKIPCPSCGSILAIKAEGLRAATKGVDQAIADFKRKLKDIGK